MVAGSGDDACRQDWRHTLAAGPAAWAGNAKSIPRSLDLLADLTVRQFWSVRASQLHIWVDPHAMRPSGSGRHWNDPGIGKRLRGSGPHLATADAPGCQGFGKPIK